MSPDFVVCESGGRPACEEDEEDEDHDHGCEGFKKKF